MNIQELIAKLEEINKIPSQGPSRPIHISLKRAWEKEVLKWSPKSDTEWEEIQGVQGSCQDWEWVMGVDKRSLLKMIQLAQALNFMTNLILDEIADEEYGQP